MLQDCRFGTTKHTAGNLVRYLPDGNLMFLGRNDRPVKIRGFRIDLGEIEGAPQGETESTLAMIWEDLLKIERIRYDNFFMLSGYSLLAAKLTGYVSSRMELNLKLRTLFEAPTIMELMPRLLEEQADKQGAPDYTWYLRISTLVKA
ncbi:hypothetical protein BGX26_012359 [Mortierella sp. AD094]|nr:hypothetical protein BGX26_012359 [Mortierella sp. AD094]